MPRTKKTIKTRTGKQKSIGPKFCAVLLICLLTIFSLVGNLILLKIVRDELETSFDYELRSAVKTLASNIDTVYESNPDSTGQQLALEMVENATWNDGQRHFWASNADFTEIIAGEKDFEKFYSGYQIETNFGFVVLSGYDEAYFNNHAYPETENFVRISSIIILVTAIFALGACATMFYRSTPRS